MAGTAAAALGTGGGDELGSALETEGRNLLAHFPALTLRTFDFGLAVKNDLLEIFLAFFAMIFKNWHRLLLCSIALLYPLREGKTRGGKAASSKLHVRS
jgi:hypothetical protein